MSKENYWRNTAAPIIARILKETEGSHSHVRNQKLYDAYPFAERQFEPFRIWQDEIKKQVAKEKPKPASQSKLF